MLKFQNISAIMYIVKRFRGVILRIIPAKN